MHGTYTDFLYSILPTMKWRVRLMRKAGRWTRRCCHSRQPKITKKRPPNQRSLAASVFSMHHLRIQVDKGPRRLVECLGLANEEVIRGK